jgi:hypothetical protein
MPERGSKLGAAVLSLPGIPLRFHREPMLALPPRLASTVLFEPLATMPDRLNHSVIHFLVSHPNWFCQCLCNRGRRRLLLTASRNHPLASGLGNVPDEDIDQMSSGLCFSFNDARTILPIFVTCQHWMNHSIPSPQR